LIEAKFRLEDIQEAFEKAATLGSYRASLIISEWCKQKLLVYCS